MNTPPQSPRDEPVCPGAPRVTRVFVRPRRGIAKRRLFLPVPPGAPEKPHTKFVRPSNVRGRKLAF